MHYIFKNVVFQFAALALIFVQVSVPRQSPSLNKTKYHALFVYFPTALIMLPNAKLS